MSNISSQSSSSSKKNNQTIFAKKYQIEMNPFQKRRYSRMFKGQMIEHPFTEVVVKQIWSVNSSKLKLFENEVKLFKELKGNPFIVNFLEYIVIDEDHYLVFEFCNGGDLQEYIMKNQPPLPDRILHDLFHQIINAMKALQLPHIMHRDIKLNNFVFHHGNLLLSDFGSRKFNDEDYIIPFEQGPLEKMAPEVLMNESQGIKAKIFSIGVLFYQLAKGDLPFHGQNKMELLGSIQRGELNLNGVSQELQNLLKGMLQFDENQRIDMEGVVKHPYMQKYVEEFTSQSRLRQMENDRKVMQNFEFQTSNVNVFQILTHQQQQNYQQQHQQPAQMRIENPPPLPPPPQVDYVQYPKGNRMHEDNGRQQRRDVLIDRDPRMNFLPHSQEGRKQSPLDSDRTLQQLRNKIEVKQEHVLYNLKAAESLYLLGTKFAEYAADRKKREPICTEIFKLSKKYIEIIEEIEGINDSINEIQTNVLSRKLKTEMLEDLEKQKIFLKQKMLDKFSIYIGGALIVVVEKSHLMISELCALQKEYNFNMLPQQDREKTIQLKEYFKQGLERLSIISYGSILDYIDTKNTYYDVFQQYIKRYILPYEEYLFYFTENELPRSNDKTFKLEYPQKLRFILLDLLVDLLNESKISFNFSQESKELHKQAVKFLTLSLIQDDSDERLTEEEEKLDRFYLTSSYQHLAKFVQESDEFEMVKYNLHYQSEKSRKETDRDLEAQNFKITKVSIKEMLLDKMNRLNEVRQSYPPWPES